MYYGYKEAEWEKRNRESKKCIYMPKEMQDKLNKLIIMLEGKGVTASYSALIRKSVDIAFSELESQCVGLSFNDLAGGKCQW